MAGDELGFDTAYVIDHLQTIPPSADPLFECWTTVAALLRSTRRIRIGQLVTANGYRNPVLQARMAATADVIGDGRFTFGIGAGWYEPDYVLLGLPFRDAPARLRELGEALPVFLEHKPARIPVLIAGGGEKVTLRLVAQYADACNVLESPEQLERKFAVLREHCERLGRAVRGDPPHVGLGLHLRRHRRRGPCRAAARVRVRVPGRPGRLRADRHAGDDPPPPRGIRCGGGPGAGDLVRRAGPAGDAAALRRRDHVHFGGPRARRSGRRITRPRAPLRGAKRA